MNDALCARVRDYYDAKLAVHGATPAGVDWNSRESQELRFAQLARLWQGEPGASIVDYGCGYGALAGWLRAAGHEGRYCGFDLSRDMAAAGARTAAALSACRFTNERRSVEPGDYAVASGIFNVKLDTPVAAWDAYVRDTLHDLASLGRRGFAFNVLTLFSDPERRRPDLYYADPVATLDYCAREFSRRVALLHDYPLYEFTVLVRS